MSNAGADDSLESVLVDVLEYHKRSTFVSLPGRVVAYDSAKQQASVDLLIRDIEPERPFPRLPAIPVLALRGGGLYITLPITTGDTGLVIFTSLDISGWLQSGQESPPVDPRRNSITSAVFLPGLSSTSQALSVDGDHVALGRVGSATDFVALAAKVDAFIGTLDTLFRTGWIVAPTDGGLALKTAYVGVFPDPPGSVAASDVKVS